MRSPLLLALPLGISLLASGLEPASAQCLVVSCPPGAVLHTTDTFESQLVGTVPFRGMTLSVPRFDPTVYALLHGVPTSAIELRGVNVEFYGEINPLIRLDSGNSAQACSATWTYDVQSIIYTNTAVGNRATLVISHEGATTALPAGNGAPPPWDVTITPPVATDSFCFADTTGLDAWTGSGTVNFQTDGYAISQAEGCAQLFSSFTNQGLLRVRARYSYCLTPPIEPGGAFCFCTGSGTAPPCNNPGGAGRGCRNSTGFGALLEAEGSNSVAANDIVFTASSLVGTQPALLFVGLNAINGGNGVGFGDGLRCAGNSVIRLGVKFPVGGTANWGPGLGTTGGWGAGNTRRFQVWYRDPTASPCGSTFNLTNGYEITFVP